MVAGSTVTLASPDSALSAGFLSSSACDRDFSVSGDDLRHTQQLHMQTTFEEESHNRQHTQEEDEEQQNDEEMQQPYHTATEIGQSETIRMDH